MDRRRTTTLRQLELLLEFAESNRELALGKLRTKEARAQSTRLWQECANLLNTEGPARTIKEWAKVWNDMKSRVKGKLLTRNSHLRGTGGGPESSVTLSPIEERVSDIIGRDIGPIPNVAHDPFAVVTDDDTQQPEEHEDVDPALIELELVDEELQFSLPTPPPQSQQPSPSPSLPPTPTPRQRRYRPRPGPADDQRPRGNTSRQAQSRRGALDESRAAILRFEELRAQTDHLLARAALAQAESAKIQAESAKIQAESLKIQAEAEKVRAETLSALASTMIGLVPDIRRFLRRRNEMPSSTESGEEYPSL